MKSVGIIQLPAAPGKEFSLELPRDAKFICLEARPTKPAGIVTPGRLEVHVAFLASVIADDFSTSLYVPRRFVLVQHDMALPENAEHLLSLMHGIDVHLFELIPPLDGVAEVHEAIAEHG